MLDPLFRLSAVRFVRLSRILAGGTLVKDSRRLFRRCGWAGNSLRSSLIGEGVEGVDDGPKGMLGSRDRLPVEKAVVANDDTDPPVEVSPSR